MLIWLWSQRDIAPGPDIRHILAGDVRSVRRFGIWNEGTQAPEVMMLSGKDFGYPSLRNFHIVVWMDVWNWQPMSIILSESEMVELNSKNPTAVVSAIDTIPNVPEKIRLE